MTKSKQIEQPADDQAEAQETEAQDAEAIPVGEVREGWRSPLDNPAHPLHHLRDA